VELRSGAYSFLVVQVCACHTEVRGQLFIWIGQRIPTIYCVVSGTKESTITMSANARRESLSLGWKLPNNNVVRCQCTQ
jgi:hypothetical protein